MFTEVVYTVVAFALEAMNFVMACRQMVDIAQAEERVILTCDRTFIRMGYSDQAFYVRTTNKQEQVREVLAHFNINVQEDNLLSRCAKCNGTFFPRCALHYTTIQQQQTAAAACAASYHSGAWLQAITCIRHMSQASCSVCKKGLNRVRLASMVLCKIFMHLVVVPRLILGLLLQ